MLTVKKTLMYINENKSQVQGRMLINTEVKRYGGKAWNTMSKRCQECEGERLLV